MKNIGNIKIGNVKLLTKSETINLIKDTIDSRLQVVWDSIEMLKSDMRRMSDELKAIYGEMNAPQII